MRPIADRAGMIRHAIMERKGYFERKPPYLKHKGIDHSVYI